MAYITIGGIGGIIFWIYGTEPFLYGFRPVINAEIHSIGEKMKTHFRVLALLVLLGGILLAACGGAAATGAPDAFDMEVAPAAAEAAATEAPLAQAVDAGSDVVNVNRSSEESAVFLANRMIIKNADIRLLVEDTDVAINGATQAIADAGGYIVSSRVWYQPWYDGVN